MKTSTLLLILFAFSLTGYAQSDNQKEDDLFESGFYYGVGYNHIKNPKINNLLEANNLDKIHNSGVGNLISQFGYNISFERFGMDFEGSIRSNSKGSQMTLSSFNFKPYVRVYHNDLISLNLSPYFAFKGGRLKIENSSGNTISADNLSEVNDGIIYLTNQSYALGLGLITCFETVIDFQLGIGYDFTLNPGPWKSQGNNLKDFPKESFNQFYVTLSFPYNQD